MPTFETAFLGSSVIVYQDKILRRSDSLFLSPVSHVGVRLISTNSPWKQGVSLSTNGIFVVGEKACCNKILLWEDTTPSKIALQVWSRDQALKIYNIWDEGDGLTCEWKDGAAMIVRDTAHGARYFCNDGHPDDNFDDLVVEISITPGRAGPVHRATLSLK